ncbi:MAG TPA: hypothetical protein VGK54_12530 [Chloroflexota bacterium]
MIGSTPTFDGKWIFLTGTKSFAVNLMAGLAFHPSILICPLVTGFVMGSRHQLTWTQGFLVGLVMGAWLSVVLGIIGAVVGMIGVFSPPGLITPRDARWVMFGWCRPVAHIVLFAGGGAGLGGHFARRDLAAKASIG